MPSSSRFSPKGALHSLQEWPSRALKLQANGAPGYRWRNTTTYLPATSRLPASPPPPSRVSGPTRTLQSISRTSTPPSMTAGK
ncbi:hypothetical protein LTS18_004746, partial [Coniosporium uncinatum]